MNNGIGTVTDRIVACSFEHAIVDSFLKPILQDGEAALAVVIHETYQC